MHSSPPTPPLRPDVALEYLISEAIAHQDFDNAVDALTQAQLDRKLAAVPSSRLLLSLLFATLPFYETGIHRSAPAAASVSLGMSDAGKTEEINASLLAAISALLSADQVSFPLGAVRLNLYSSMASRQHPHPPRAMLYNAIAALAAKQRTAQMVLALLLVNPTADIFSAAVPPELAQPSWLTISFRKTAINRATQAYTASLRRLAQLEALKRAGLSVSVPEPPDKISIRIAKLNERPKPNPVAVTGEVGSGLALAVVEAPRHLFYDEAVAVALSDAAGAHTAFVTWRAFVQTLQLRGVLPPSVIPLSSSFSPRLGSPMFDLRHLSSHNLRFTDPPVHLVQIFSVAPPNAPVLPPFHHLGDELPRLAPLLPLEDAAVIAARTDADLCDRATTVLFSPPPGTLDTTALANHAVALRGDAIRWLQSAVNGWGGRMAEPEAAMLCFALLDLAFATPFVEQLANRASGSLSDPTSAGTVGSGRSGRKRARSSVASASADSSAQQIAVWSARMAPGAALAVAMDVSNRMSARGQSSQALHVKAITYRSAARLIDAFSRAEVLEATLRPVPTAAPASRRAAASSVSRPSGPLAALLSSTSAANATTAATRSQRRRSEQRGRRVQDFVDAVRNRPPFPEIRQGPLELLETACDAAWASVQMDPASSRLWSTACSLDAEKMALVDPSWAASSLASLSESSFLAVDSVLNDLLLPLREALQTQRDELLTREVPFNLTAAAFDASWDVLVTRLTASLSVLCWFPPALVPALDASVACGAVAAAVTPGGSFVVDALNLLAGVAGHRDRLGPDVVASCQVPTLSSTQLHTVFGHKLPPARHSLGDARETNFIATHFANVPSSAAALAVLEASVAQPDCLCGEDAEFDQHAVCVCLLASALVFKAVELGANNLDSADTAGTHRGSIAALGAFFRTRWWLCNLNDFSVPARCISVCPYCQAKLILALTMRIAID
jgi:hypothetical protein